MKTKTKTKTKLPTEQELDEMLKAIVRSVMKDNMQASVKACDAFRLLLRTSARKVDSNLIGNAYQRPRGQ